MRENTRCEVEEPISTPTLRTTISSSSTSERPVEEKKMRPPSASSVIIEITNLCKSRATKPVQCRQASIRSGHRTHSFGSRLRRAEAKTEIDHVVFSYLL